MKKNEEKVSFGEALKLNWRGFMLVYKQRPQMIVSRLVAPIWDTVVSYLVIWLSARVIDELAGNRDVERLKFLVIMTLAVTAVSALISAFIRRWRDIENVATWFEVIRIFINKKASLDYADLDNPKTHELISAIEMNRRFTGGGLFRVVGYFENIFGSLFQIGGGLLLTISFFTSRSTVNTGSVISPDSPLITIAVAIALIVAVFLSSHMKNKADGIWASKAKTRVYGNRAFGHYGWLGCDDGAAADVRLYEQWKISGKYVANKVSTFESKGLYAKLCRYPVGVYYAISNGISILFSAVVNAFICVKALAGAFGVGMVAQYTTSTTRVFFGIGSLIQLYGSLKNNVPYLKLEFELLDMKNTLARGTRHVEPAREDEGIEFRNVSFKYPGSDEYVLKDVNIKFRTGSRLAAVGMNGSGKTTFIKLLCRLYDPTEGEILYNGVNIKEYDYDEYLNMFGVVFQDFYITDFKLGENVSAGPITDPEKVRECLEEAGFGDKLREYKDGIDTYIGKGYGWEGVDVSGGENQKIAIARALYKDAPFIILDEPTASLDPLAEADIYSKFNEIAKNKSAIYISHRLSSCKFCDEIAVFHEGRIIEQGTHEALLSNEQGKYYELWHAQAQYYT